MLILKCHHFGCLRLILLLCWIFGGTPASEGSRFQDPESRLDLVDLITQKGYAAEIHDVITEDGYIIGVHRIPYPIDGIYEPADEEKWGRPAVLLVHGGTQSAFDWLANRVDNSLGFILADAGYDVWMMNYRGTPDSIQHTKYTVKDKAYWDFSLHEMALYDVPAVIDYILSVTGQQSLYYVGFSWGNTMYYMAMSLRPEYNSKVRLMISLGPSAYQHEFPNGLDFLAPVIQAVSWMGYRIGGHIIRMDELTKIPRFYLPILCSTRLTSVIFCETFGSLIFGFDYKQTNSSNFGRNILARTPNAISLKTIAHWMQTVTSRRFREFDYGETRNLELYGHSSPPDYDLGRVTSPVALIWAENDKIGHPKATTRIAARLPNVVYNRPVPYRDFNHIDFTYAIDARTLVYDTVLQLMQMY